MRGWRAEKRNLIARASRHAGASRRATCAQVGRRPVAHQKMRSSRPEAGSACYLRRLRQRTPLDEPATAGSLLSQLLAGTRSGPGGSSGAARVPRCDKARGRRTPSRLDARLAKRPQSGRGEGRISEVRHAGIRSHHHMSSPGLTVFPLSHLRERAFPRDLAAKLASRMAERVRGDFLLTPLRGLPLTALVVRARALPQGESGTSLRVQSSLTPIGARRWRGGHPFARDRRRRYGLRASRGSRRAIAPIEQLPPAAILRPSGRARHRHLGRCGG